MPETVLSGAIRGIKKDELLTLVYLADLMAVAIPVRPRGTRVRRISMNAIYTIAVLARVLLAAETGAVTGFIAVLDAAGVFCAVR